MKKLYTLSLLFAVTLSFGQAFTAKYDFAGVTSGATGSGMTDPTPVPTAAGVAFGSFSVVNANLTEGAAQSSSGAGRFSFSFQPLGATNTVDTYATLTGSVDPAIYYQVTLTPSSGQKLSISGLTFRAQRSGTGVRTFVVRSSADNFATNLPASVVDEANVSVQTGNVFFFKLDAFTQGTNGQTITLGTTHNDLTSPVTFRFYGYNAEGTGGNFSIDDVEFTGATAALSIKENAIAGLKVYPNPLSGSTLFIDTNANAEKAVVIYDVLGKVVLNTKISSNSVNVSNLNGGVYIVKITEEGKTATRKLVIK